MGALCFGKLNAPHEQGSGCQEERERLRWGCHGGECSCGGGKYLCVEGLHLLGECSRTMGGRPCGSRSLERVGLPLHHRGFCCAAARGVQSQACVGGGRSRTGEDKGQKNQEFAVSDAFNAWRLQRRTGGTVRRGWGKIEILTFFSPLV